MGTNHHHPGGVRDGPPYISLESVAENTRRFSGRWRSRLPCRRTPSRRTSGIVHFPGFNPALVMALAFGVSLALGVPVGFAILFSGFLATLGADLLIPAAVVQNMVNGASSFVLLAIPLFLLAGYLMNAGGLTAWPDGVRSHARRPPPRRIGPGERGDQHAVWRRVGFFERRRSDQFEDHGAANDWPRVTRLRSAARSRRHRRFCRISSPRLIAMLIYAAAANVSVGRLFVAALGPGLLLTVLLLLAVHIVSVRRQYGRGGSRAGYGDRIKAFWRAIPVLIIAVWILGGIRFGS